MSDKPVKIFLAKIPQTFDINCCANAVKTAFATDLTNIYVDNVTSRKSDKSRKESLSALLLLLHGLEAVGADPFGISIARSDNGKPYFKCGCDLHFSISHDRDLVAVALSEQNVGIDVQSNHNFENCKKIAERFFTDREISDIQNGNSDFFDVWTKKEAFCKLSDAPLSSIVGSELPQNIFFYTSKTENLTLSLATHTPTNVLVYNLDFAKFNNL